MSFATLRSQILAGEPVWGVMVMEVFTTGISAIAKQAGAQFVLYDMEHSGVGIETIKTQMALARGNDVMPWVRVPGTHYTFISQALDAGARGVMVPMVESAEQARNIAAWAKYPPIGRRGAAFGVAHDNYSEGPVADKIAAANAQTLVIAQIETVAGVEAAEDIFAVDGIDMVWLGQFDLTNFQGIPAQFGNPRYLELVHRLVAAARKHGKPIGLTVPDANWAKTYQAKGFHCMAYGPEHAVLLRALREGLAACGNEGDVR